MSAPDIVEQVAEAIYASIHGPTPATPWGKVRGSYRRSYYVNAKAALAAIEKSGTVQYATEGVEWDGRTIEHNTWPDEETARRKTLAYGGRVVSRLVLPWKVVD